MMMMMMVVLCPAYNIHILGEWVDPSQDQWKPNNLDNIQEEAIFTLFYTALFSFVSIIILSYWLLINKVKTAIANMGKILKKIINNT